MHEGLESLAVDITRGRLPAKKLLGLSMASGDGC